MLMRRSGCIPRRSRGQLPVGAQLIGIHEIREIYHMLTGPVWAVAPHCEFEHIHPFIDGNGRTGRLVLNLILVRLGLPPVVILKQQRRTYLNALQAADNGDVGALAELLARVITDNLERFILPAVAGPARMVPISALVTREISLEALRGAICRGHLCQIVLDVVE